MQTDRKKRSGFMLAYPFEEKRLYKWGFPVLVQPKLDGVRCGLDFDESGNVILRSSTQEVITSVPHINAEIEELCTSSNITIPMLDGELYVHGLSFEDIYSITSRTVNFHEQFEHMEFHVFDLMETTYPQYIRTDKLRDFMSLVRPDSPIKYVSTRVACSFEEVWNHYNDYLSEGYEGIIVRDINAPYIKRRSTQVMKFKPKKDDWYEIIGTLEEFDKYGNPKGCLGRIICVGSTGDIFPVYSGLTDELRQELWKKDLTGWLLHVSYQSIFPKTNKPRHPCLYQTDSVKIEIINPEQVLTGHTHDGPPVGVVEMDPNTD